MDEQVKEKFIIKTSGSEDKPKYYFGRMENKSENKVIEPEKIFCSLCWKDKITKTYGKQTSSSNLYRHLENVHGINIKNIPPKNQKKIDEVLVKPQTTTVHNANKTIADKYRIGRELALLVCRTLTSFSFVTDEAFQDFVIKIGGVKDRSDFPSRSTISRQCLDDIYSRCYSDLKALIECKMGETGSITTDMWTDGYKKVSYITMTLHFIAADMQLINVTLSTQSIHGSHTGENLSKEIEKVLMDFNLLGKNLIFVTDGGSNVIKATRLLGYQRQPCIAHALHRLVMKDLMEDQRIVRLKEIVSTLKGIYRALSSKKPELEKMFKAKENEKMWEHFLENCAKIGDEEDSAEQFFTFEWETLGSYTSLKKMCETRWSSMLLMIDSYVKSQDLYQEAIMKIKRFDLLLADNDLTILKEVIPVLEIFANATKLLEGSNYSTINLGLLVYKEIQNSLVDLQKKSTKSEIQATMCEILKNHLEKRYKVTEEMLLGALLDPTLQHLPAIEEWLKENNFESRSDFLFSKINDENGKEPDLPLHENVDSKSIRLALANKHLPQNNPACTTLREEYASFKCVKDRVEDPLEWWSAKRSVFPVLSEKVRNVFCIPLTSAPSERNFSSAGGVITQKRSRLSPSTASKILLIHDNYKTLQKYKIVN
ncbi:E3 SUMO-protein ligase ZBED1-like [Phlebotomus papatasi]|uniref:E3 SUMO-protein ligase ZBED1-like n=1 Tax=Phlebotomus papatasi TaxID=29031 RepID=UPI002483AA28|nr:E3 SUMO-protein ligase ZBED1-like [Phlebotomus papatasi]